MYSLFIWIVGFMLVGFSVQLSKLLMMGNVSSECLIIVATGLLLMLLSPSLIKRGY